MTKTLTVEHTLDYGYCVQEKEYSETGKLIYVQTYFVTVNDSTDAIWYCGQVKDLIERIRGE